ncbi:hypothetical protein AB0M45_17040 [Nocardia sp. NPDC051787]|uniref:hypothetical protein n=1 Tax=Nocardia sp. NPDC051787 TaxID=3155415 RepID=UPI0034166D0E
MRMPRSNSSAARNLYLASDYLATIPILARTRRWCTQHHPRRRRLHRVDDPGPEKPFPRDEHRELVTSLRNPRGVEVFVAWAVAGREAGHPWADLFGGDHGLLPTPRRAPATPRTFRRTW